MNRPHLWKGCPSVAVCLFCLLLIVSCGQRRVSTTSELTLETYSQYAVGGYTLHAENIRRQIRYIAANDSDRLLVDVQTRRYYKNQKPLVWINRLGITAQADTLVAWLKSETRLGFSARRFRLAEIEQDLQTLRTLQVDGEQRQIDRVAGRLEYNLTKACLRYAAGQRFGYANPTRLFNSLDTLRPGKPDTTQTAVRYRMLFDVDMDHQSRDFLSETIRKVAHDSLPQHLRAIQPKDENYRLLATYYADHASSLPSSLREKLVCNIERFRWRRKETPGKYHKYVVVNIPSYHLFAIDGPDTLTMRVGCGSLETKTPLLSSAIKRMDVNPKWVMPRSIIEKDIVRHAGDSRYFRSRNYYVVDKRTGKEVAPERITTDILYDRNYNVVQRGGKGNSLGRIIFRFDNNFSIYLHDTPNRQFFQREDRSVSHGCVRVERPFDLAVFMMHEKDLKIIAKIDYSMRADSLEDKTMAIASVPLERPVPIFITYYTLLPKKKAAGIKLFEYADVYGYDSVLYQFLKENYL